MTIRCLRRPNSVSGNRIHHHPPQTMQTQEKPLPKIPSNDSKMLSSSPTCRPTTGKEDKKVPQVIQPSTSSSLTPLSTNDSYYSPNDWPLQAKARPWSPIFNQDEHQNRTNQRKLSSDTIGGQSLRGLRELYDPFQPEKSRLDTESLYEEEACVPDRQERSSGLWRVLKMFGFGGGMESKNGYSGIERVKLLEDDAEV